MKSIAKKKETGKTPLVLLQQACIPHYRRRLLETLGADGRFQLVVLADPEVDVPFLRLSDTPNGYTFEPAKQYAIRLPLQPSFSWQPGVIAKMFRDRPDVVIAQGSPYDLTAWALTVAGRILGTTVLLWTHGLQGEESGLKWIVRKCLYRLSCGLLLYGDHAKRLLVAKGFPADRLHVIYNSLDDCEQEEVFRRTTEQDRAAFRRSIGIQASERLICFTGRLQPVKRLPSLLQALALVVQRGKRVHLVLVGDGSERVRLESLSAELGLARLVHFLGAVYDESRLGLVISASDLAVVPSGAGLTVMHSLAYGTPVLLHDKVEEHFPEWEAVREEETGWFYRWGEVSDCADKIIAALFPKPRKHGMTTMCRSMIGNRYNTTTHAGLFIEAIAKHCRLVPLAEKKQAFTDAIVPSGPLEHPIEAGH
jgi:glycosyltransferase involved in cell wall biosynthesis